MQGTHWLIFYLKKRKRNGLAQAVSNLMLELTLVGFVALLLTVLQGPIASICGEPRYTALRSALACKEGSRRCTKLCVWLCVGRLRAVPTLPGACFVTLSAVPYSPGSYEKWDLIR